MSKVSLDDVGQWINLANPRLGAEVISASDDFFAPKERLIQASEPVFIPDKYDEHGKWMDGWESRRKRGPGHDHCVVRLGSPGMIRAVDIDTRHFTGNYPPGASLEACSSQRPPDDTTTWTGIIPEVRLQGDSHNLFSVENSGPWTYLRLNIFPDGGVARLRVYGEVHCDRSTLDPAKKTDLIAMLNGGRALQCNDEHFGSMQNLLLPGRGLNMGDGWETRRRREPGNDWAIVKLGHPGVVKEIEIDTAFFKGNYPDRVSIEACSDGDGICNGPPENWPWQVLLPEQKLQMDKQHFYKAEVNDLGVISHARINIFPDGGLSRVRLLGYVQSA